VANAAAAVNAVDVAVVPTLRAAMVVATKTGIVINRAVKAKTVNVRARSVVTGRATAKRVRRVKAVAMDNVASARRAMNKRRQMLKALSIRKPHRHRLSSRSVNSNLAAMARRAKVAKAAADAADAVGVDVTVANALHRMQQANRQRLPTMASMLSTRLCLHLRRHKRRHPLKARPSNPAATTHRSVKWPNQRHLLKLRLSQRP
jgi:hypothetical protein